MFRLLHSVIRVLIKGLKAHILFFLSVVFFGAAVLVYNHSFFVSETKRGSEEAAKEVEQNLSREISTLNNQMKEVFRVITLNGISFSKLANIGEYPVYVYQGNKLIYWSTNEIALKGRLKSTQGGFEYVELANGTFLYQSKEFIGNGYDYSVIGVLPLKKVWAFNNANLQPELNVNIFGQKEYHIIGPNDVPADSVCYTVHARMGEDELFKVIPIKREKRSLLIIVVWLGLLFSGFVSLMIYVIRWVNFFNRNQIYWASILILGFYLFEVRYFMIASEFPGRYFTIDLFNPVHFASSSLNSSMGDLILNLSAFLIWFVYVFVLFLRTGFKFWLESFKERSALVLTFCVIGLSYYVVFWSFDLFLDFFSHSKWNFDITESFGFNQFKLGYILIFIQVSILYFGINHIVFRLVSIFDYWNNTSLKYMLLSISTIFIGINILYGDGNSILVLAHGTLLFSIHQFKLHRNFRVFRYQTYLYFIITSISISFIGSMALYEYSSSKMYDEKMVFAEELVHHHDFQGAYLLHEIAEQVKDDEYIKRIFTKPFASKQMIAKKIRKIYFNDYFDKYDIQVSVYDLNGKPYVFNHLQGNYNSLKKKFDHQQYLTEHKDLFFINSFKQYYLSKYLQFLDIEINDFVIGHVVIDLTLKKANATSFLPRLLQSDEGGEDKRKEFDYAIFDGDLQFSKGEYNYSDFFDNFESSNKSIKEMIYGGYHHVIYRIGLNQMVVVSSTHNAVKRIYTNFSYLFLILTILTFVLVLFGTFYLRAKDRYYTFSSKVQTYLNIAYFTPLIIVSIVTTGILSSTFQKDLIESFKDRAENLNENFTSYLEKYLNDEITFAEFNQDIEALSRNTNMDINLYDQEGHLISSSQTLIFETSLLGKMINPEAMEKIVDQSNSFIHIPERIGQFDYSSIYLSVLSPNSNELIGIIGIPFYDASKDLDEKKLTVLTSIMNIFTVIFILILIVSYAAFKNLTDPLKLIAGKLKRTSFSGVNETLEWKGNDEIGILIAEYNLMLRKLEESKVALSQVEKESAWKEMAQQVAHEIKNPLTPMKLKLQFLKRGLSQSGQENDVKTIDSIDALLLQVDTLSDIATSFSSFAKMPTPKAEKFNLVDILDDIATLYKADEEIEFVSDWGDRQFVEVVADKKLFGRILTNLILNGKQSVNAGVKPVIHLEMSVKNEIALVSVRDNGDGIPPEIQHKVFLPNFSTKYTGSGIGLAVAKRGIEHAGGEIWFETSETTGTTFFIKLPLA